jgi:hypothetical protein
MTTYNSDIVALVGVVDGINTTFTTPSNFVPGTSRIIINGQVYEPNDSEFGWSEIDNETIELTNAPLTGDVLQAFYQNLDTSSELLQGSPIDPTGTYT